MPRKKRRAPQPDTINPRPRPVPEQPADRIDKVVPADEPLAVTMPEGIPPARRDKRR
jgi:hypothetical protein